MRAESSRIAGGCELGLLMRRLAGLAAIPLAGLLGSGFLMPATAAADGENYTIAPPAELFDNPKHPRLQDFLSKVL